MTLLEAQQTRINLPAHPNTTLGAIVGADPSYLDWLEAQPWLDFVTREAVRILRSHHGRTQTPKPAPRQASRQMNLF